MATWASLEATKQQIYETNEDAITIDGSDNVLTPDEFLGNPVVETYKSKAKEIMKHDLLNILNLDANDTTDLSTLDDIVNYNETSLQLALSYLQLCLFYRRFNDGYESQSGQRQTEYCSLYNTEKNKFSGLRDDSSQNLKFESIQLKR